MTQTLLAPAEIVFIPLSKLAKSPRNMRTTDDGDIEGLAASIAAHGLISSLVVEAQDERFGVVAGGRRWAALRLLSKTKRLAKGFEVPCRIVDETEAHDISVAENESRKDPHPADQFAAFAKMIAAGKTVDDVASRHNVSVTVVSQRLRLSNLAPELMAAFRADKLNLGQMIALSITEDHDAQLAVWQEASRRGKWAMDPERLRQALTEGDIDANRDKRAKYVTLATYEKNDGYVKRDLFSDSIFVGDVELLERLALAKLEKTATKLRKEGWGWVEARLDCNYTELSRFSRLEATRRPHTPAERSEVEALVRELEQLQGEIEDLYDNAEEDTGANDVEVEKREDRCREIESRKDAIDNERLVNDESMRQHAGAIVYIEHGGNAKVERGLVKPEHRKAIQREAAVVAGVSETEYANADLADRDKPVYGETLMRRITAHRTLAVRAQLATKPAVALAALAHALLGATFYEQRNNTALSVTARDDARLSIIDGAIADTAAGRLLAERRESIRAMLPETVEGLFAWTLAQSVDVLTTCIAFCIAGSLDLVQDRSATRTVAGKAISNADDLIASLDMDMADWWQADPSFFASLSKAQMAAAVSEAAGDDAGAPIQKLKKDAAIDAALAAVAGTRWLPAPLRGRGF